MAYKQSPGRQMMPKTGRGISPTLMSCSPAKQEPKKGKNPVTGNQPPSYTPGELGGSFDWNQANRTTYNPNSKNFNPNLVGATHNPNTGNWEANKVEKFEVFKQPNSEAINVIKRGGKTILRNTSGGDESSIGNKSFNEKAKEAYRSYVGDSLSTAHSNERQARIYTARTAGSAPETKESKEAMIKYQAAKTKKVLAEKKKKGQI
jgi:hypothetical protein